MSATPPRHLHDLFLGLQSAAQSLDWHPNTDPRIHHTNARNIRRDRDWEAQREVTGRIVFPRDVVFHLQIRLEQLGQESQHRVIIFGRRVRGLNFATPNTQRATFNSDHVDATGYWLRPNLDAAEKSGLAPLLPGAAFPQWDGRHIQLGSEIPFIILRRFLIALAAVEQIKGGWPTAPLPFAPESNGSLAAFEPRDLVALTEIEEGRVHRIPVNRRSRCQRLLGEAREFFRAQSPDGRLRCHICAWAPAIPTRSAIVQIHHLKPLSDYPKQGRRLTLAQALANLAPLCPNCHRIIESRPDGGCYNLAELQSALARPHSRSSKS